MLHGHGNIEMNTTLVDTW